MKDLGVTIDASEAKAKFVVVFLFACILCFSECGRKPRENQTNSSPSDSSDEWLQYTPTIVTLAGKLQQVHSFGPPNFGETPEKDQKVSYFAVVLSRPINIRGDSLQDTLRNLDSVQLFFIQYHPTVDLDSLINHAVVVKGKLSQAQFPGEYTKATVQVSDLQALDDAESSLKH